MARGRSRDTRATLALARSHMSRTSRRNGRIGDHSLSWWLAHSRTLCRRAATRARARARGCRVPAHQDLVAGRGDGLDLVGASTVGHRTDLARDLATARFDDPGGAGLV